MARSLHHNTDIPFGRPQHCPRYLLFGRRIDDILRKSSDGTAPSLGVSHNARRHTGVVGVDRVNNALRPGGVVWAYDQYFFTLVQLSVETKGFPV